MTKKLPHDLDGRVLHVGDWVDWDDPDADDETYREHLTSAELEELERYPERLPALYELAIERGAESWHFQINGFDHDGDINPAAPLGWVPARSVVKSIRQEGPLIVSGRPSAYLKGRSES